MELIFSTTSMCKQAKIFFNDFVVSEWESERKTMSNFIISYFITSLSLSIFLFFSHVSTLLHHSSFPRELKIKLSQFAKVEKKSLLTNKKENFLFAKKSRHDTLWNERKFPLGRYVTRNLCAKSGNHFLLYLKIDKNANTHRKIQWRNREKHFWGSPREKESSTI